jgi:hypothetical protein
LVRGRLHFVFLRSSLSSAPFEPQTRGLATQPAQVQPSGKGKFVTCRKSVAIIVSIQLTLLADGDKQWSGAANMKKHSADAS